MRYLKPTDMVMCLAWMTAIDQLLGVWQGSGGWRVLWVRLDPLWRGEPGIAMLIRDEPLACAIEQIDRDDVVTARPFEYLPEVVSIRSALDAPPFSMAQNAEHAAVLRAERDLGARPDRWVNPVTEPGWDYLCRLRGHA